MPLSSSTLRLETSCISISGISKSVVSVANSGNRRQSRPVRSKLLQSILALEDLGKAEELVVLYDPANPSINTAWVA